MLRSLIRFVWIAFMGSSLLVDVIPWEMWPCFPSTVLGIT